MCSGDFFAIHKIILDPYGTSGINERPLQRGFQKTPTIKPLKPPKLNIDQGAADAAAAHQKDLLAVAFGLNDTKLTGQQGLGSVPKSLLTPKTTLGGY